MADDYLKSIRVLAAQAVKKRDGDYLFRFVTRWYSREFHTPIAEVEAIPLDELLQHYFECKYEGMEEEDLDEEVAKLIETEEETRAREAKEAEDDAADEAFFQEELRKHKEEEAKAKADEAKQRMDQLPTHDNKPIRNVLDRDAPLAGTSEDKSVRELPPDIKIAFVPESELDDLDAWDLLGPPKKDEK